MPLPFEDVSEFIAESHEDRVDGASGGMGKEVPSLGVIFPWNTNQGTNSQSAM